MKYHHFLQIIIMARVCLVVLIGIPAAGKTTFCRNITEKLNKLDDFCCCNIEYDEMQSQIEKEIGNNAQDQYKHVRNRIFCNVESVLKEVLQLNNENIHVLLIDDNMYYKSMRYQYYKLCGKYEIAFLQVYIDVPIGEALLRNNIRDAKAQLSKVVIVNIAAKLEQPGTEHWELNVLSLKADDLLEKSTFDKFRKRVLSSLDKPVRMKKIENTKSTSQSHSMLHHIDLTLRQIVSKTMASRAQSTHGNLYHVKKKEIIEKIKRNEIVIGDRWTQQQLYDFLSRFFE